MLAACYGSSCAASNTAEHEYPFFSVDVLPVIVLFLQLLFGHGDSTLSSFICSDRHVGTSTRSELSGFQLAKDATEALTLAHHLPSLLL